MYTATSIDVFIAAYSGAIASYQKTRVPRSTALGNFERISNAALAYAEEFDTVFATVLPNELQLQEIAAISEQFITYPNNDTHSRVPATYLKVVNSVIAMMSETAAVVAANVTNPIPVPTPVSESVIQLNTVSGVSGSLYATVPATAVAAIVQGYYVPGDKGGGSFFWVPSSAATDNGGTVINPTGHVGNGRWIRIWSGALYSEWFGAKGNAVTDDRAALMALIAALPTTGGGMQLGAGVYKLSDELTWNTRSNLHIFSTEGGTILQAKDKAAFDFSICDNVEIDSIKFLGTVQVDGGNPGGGNTGQTCIEFSLSTNVNIHDCTFSNVGGYGVFIANDNTRVNVHHNIFDETMAGCQTGGENVNNDQISICDNMFKGFIPTGGAGTLGSDDMIAVLGTVGNINVSRNFIDKRGVDVASKAKVQATCIDLSIVGAFTVASVLCCDNICVNDISTSGIAGDRPAIQITIVGGTFDDVNISKNEVRSCDQGILVSTGGTVNNLLVCDNQLRDIVDGGGAGTIPDGISIKGQGGSSVKGIIVGRNTLKSIAGAGIIFDNLTQIDVKANYIETTGNYGIVGTSTTDASIEGNTVKSAGSFGIATSVFTSLRIVGNTVIDSFNDNFEIAVGCDDLICTSNVSRGSYNGYQFNTLNKAVIANNIAQSTVNDGFQFTGGYTSVSFIGNLANLCGAFGLNLAGANCTGVFIGNYLTANVAGALNDVTTGATVNEFLANPNALQPFAKAGIGVPTAGQSPVSTGTAWETNGMTQGADLTNADVHIDVTQGNIRYLRAATLTGNHTVTLDTTGAVADEVIGIVREDVTANTYAVINGGPAAGTLYTFPVSVKRVAYFKFDGTNWNSAGNSAITSSL